MINIKIDFDERTGNLNFDGFPPNVVTSLGILDLVKILVTKELMPDKVLESPRIITPHLKKVPD